MLFVDMEATRNLRHGHVGEREGVFLGFYISAGRQPLDKAGRQPLFFSKGSFAFPRLYQEFDAIYNPSFGRAIAIFVLLDWGREGSLSYRSYHRGARAECAI
jgi:hypothetical protein